MTSTDQPSTDQPSTDQPSTDQPSSASGSSTSGPSISVLIVGAGSTGVLTGYDLSRAGAEVTFLVRPHRLEQLSRAQVLYSYDDDTVDRYSGYHLSTDPAQALASSYDFVVVTLDGASLRADAGLALVEAIGRAYRGTPTGVVLGSVGIDVRAWFVSRSGLDDTQVVLGSPGALIYEVPKAPMPQQAGVSPELLQGSDYGYRHLGPAGFIVDDSAPRLAEAFTAAYTGPGLRPATTMAAQDSALQGASFGVIAAWELLGWSPLADLDPADPTWQLGVEAMREVQRLDLFGAAGQAAAGATTAEGVLAMFQQLEQLSQPLDFAAFNAYHHGGKVNGQDHAILREALERGRTEGAVMPALTALVAQLPSAH